MAVASYTTDLVNITLADSITNWVALGGGASGLGVGADFAMEGTLCVDKAVTASEKGQIFNNVTTITPGTNEHFFVWVYLATPGLANTLINRGLGVVIGTSTTAYNTFHVEGSNTYGAVGRVGKCYPIRYVTTANTSIPYRTLTGTPGAAPQYFGATTNITGTVKGSNLGVDAIRRGTGIYITAGDSSTPATFDGTATFDNDITRRWGVLLFLGGSSYELQGRYVIGQTSAKVATLAYHKDSNKNITIVDTPHTQTDFTQIVVDHASTYVEWENITIEAAGTNNRGLILFNNASTVAKLTGCNFIKIGATTLRSLVDTTRCSWRQAGRVTTNGAILNSCTISNSFDTSAVLVSSLGTLLKCTFTSSGTGHAVELNSLGSGSMDWDNTLSGYATANGSTGNEAIFVNVASGNLTINVTGGSVPTIRTAGAVVTVVSGTVTITINVKNSSGTAIESARVLVLASDNLGSLPYNTAVTITNSGTTATVSHTTHNLLTNDYVFISGASIEANNGAFLITKINDNSYSYTLLSAPGANPTGSIKSTYVAITGLTDINGTISASRVYSSNQGITGWARKSTTPPLYQQGTITGVINSSTGFSTIIQLISDE